MPEDGIIGNAALATRVRRDDVVIVLDSIIKQPAPWPQ
jgi:hypothetical protein